MRENSEASLILAKIRKHCLSNTGHGICCVRVLARYLVSLFFLNNYSLRQPKGE
jgi:hypothetical protein